MEEYNENGIWEAPIKIVYDEDCIIFGGNYEQEGGAK